MRKYVCLCLTVMILATSSTTVLAKDVSSEFGDMEVISENSLSPQSEQSLPKNRNWFNLLRTTYAGYDLHYSKNMALEGNSMGYIYGQAKCPSFYIGNARMESVGCEIAAAYNAIKLRGLTIPCSSIIRAFEKNGYLMTKGFLGSDPYAIGEYFSTNTVYTLTEYTDYSSMNNLVKNNISAFNVYIVSFWNSESITDGLHTVCFYTKDGGNKIYIYNKSNSCTDIKEESSFSSYVDSDRFIVGYYVPRMGRMLNEN